MRRSAFANPGTVPGTFTYNPAQPTYWTEWLSWWMIRMVDVMVVQGFDFNQPAATEYDTFNTALGTWFSDLTSWWDSAVAARDAENPIPAFPSLPAIPVDGGIPGILNVLLQIANVTSLLTKLRKDLDSTTEAGELENILKQAFLEPNNADSIIHKAFVLSSPASIGVSANAIKTLLNTLNEEVILLRELFEVTPDSGEAVLKTALLNATDDSLIDALAAVGLHLSVEPQGIHAHYSDEA